MTNREALIWLVALSAAVTTPLFRAQGTNLDLSHLPYYPALNQAIRHNLPQDLESSLTKLRLADDSLDAYVKVVPYDPYDPAVQSHIILVFISDRHDLSVLQVYRGDSAGFALVSQLRSIGKGTLLSLEFKDVDCDKENEILLKTQSAASQDRRMDVLALRGDSLESITTKLIPELQGGILSAYDMGFEAMNKCASMLTIVKKEGQNRQTTTTYHYEYNAGTKSYDMLWYDGHTDLPDSAHRTLDLTQMHYSDALKAAIQKYIPRDIRDSLLTTSAPDLYGGAIRLYSFPKNAREPNDSALLILYITGWSNQPSLQYLLPAPEGWRLVNQIRDLACEGLSNMEFHDVDCDGSNEIFLESAVGARGNSALNILGLRGDTLALLDGELLAGAIFARDIEVRKLAECNWEIVVGIEDRSFNRQIGSTETYRFDHESHKFKKVESKKVETSK